MFVEISVLKSHVNYILGDSYLQLKLNKNQSAKPALCCKTSLVLQICVCVWFVSSWAVISSNNRQRYQRRHVLFYACRHTQSVRMIEINLCVLPSLSRSHQSWLNCAMTSISAQGNSSGYLIWLHNRGALCWDFLLFMSKKIHMLYKNTHMLYKKYTHTIQKYTCYICYMNCYMKSETSVNF